jgi:septum site-determining protein MinD
VNPQLIKRGDMLTPDDVLELLAVELVGIVPEDEYVVISSNRGQPVAMDGKSRAGEAFQNIARRLNGETVPFLNLDQKEDIFKKIARMMRRDERTGGI